MLSSYNRPSSIRMDILDAYVIGYCIRLVIPKFDARHDYNYVNSTHCITSFSQSYSNLYIVYSNTNGNSFAWASSIPTSNYFHYSIKELLTYLYDKIESN
jgi:hypothetical protein